MRLFSQFLLAVASYELGLCLGLTNSTRDNWECMKDGIARPAKANKLPRKRPSGDGPFSRYSEVMYSVILRNEGTFLD